MCESIEIPELSCFTRVQVLVKVYHTTVVSSQKGLSSYEKKYDGKLISLKKFICKKIYIISEENRGSIELSSKSSNSRKKEYFAQCYSIFTSSALYLQTHRLLMKE